MSDHDNQCEVTHNTSGNACGCELRAELATLRELLTEARTAVRFIIGGQGLLTRIDAALAARPKEANDV